MRRCALTVIVSRAVSIVTGGVVIVAIVAIAAVSVTLVTVALVPVVPVALVPALALTPTPPASPAAVASAPGSVLLLLVHLLRLGDLQLTLRNKQRVGPHRSSDLREFSGVDVPAPLQSCGISSPDTS